MLRRLILATVVFLAATCLAQEEKPQYQYFSGTVVSHSAEKITVARTILGTNSSSRTFAISSDTQIDGKLHEKARVTVQFVTKEDVDRAVMIVVRDGTRKK